MLTRDERRQFDEIARRTGREAAVTGTSPQIAVPMAVRLTMLGVLVIGTGALTSRTTDDLVVIFVAVAGVAATIVATALFAFAGTSDGRRRGSAMSSINRLWLRLTTCEEIGCGDRPVHLGWCTEHDPAYDAGPDEYWGEDRNSPDSDCR